ncbi:hypothetical protein [Runella sp.]|uniref:hypothetical protein n=1 Tax=Runella sp. TaxID=1960881 RepID=UPI003D0B07C7
MTIYHLRPVNHQGRKSIKYYLKRKNDCEHDASAAEDQKMVVELNRSIRLIETKVAASYADNRMTSIQLYFNDNHGGTTPETVPNPLRCKLNIQGKNRFERVINRDIISTEEYGNLPKAESFKGFKEKW